jgi:hypothetical protein
MASSSWPVWLLAAAAMAAATFLAPPPVAAEDYLVGGTTGWNLSYSIGWPEGKKFKVGDNLGTKLRHHRHCCFRLSKLHILHYSQITYCQLKGALLSRNESEGSQGLHDPSCFGAGLVLDGGLLFGN